MPTDFQILITCEHGGNYIPEYYKKWFKNKKNILNSHLGYDPGALEMARNVFHKLRCPFVYEKVSRLLIEQNRSLGRGMVFSPISHLLSELDKRKTVTEIYNPYHRKVEFVIDDAVKKKIFTYHFSIHSFTPVLNEKIRNADIGLLYDPSRKIEKNISAIIATILEREIPGLKSRKNYPYKGVSDGLTTFLRGKKPDSSYCGIEIELNQKHFFKNSEIWRGLMKKMPSCLNFVCHVAR